MPARRLFPLLALTPLLSGCALLGAELTPVTALERQLNGTFEGYATGVTGRVPYRLTLVYTQRSAQATGVLLNLQSRKAYSVTGRFTWGGQSGSLDLNGYEGSAWRATFRGEMTAGQVTGRLNSVVLGREVLPFNLTLNRVADLERAP